MQYTCKYLSPLGEMLLASDGGGIDGCLVPRDRNTMLPLWRLRMRRNHCRCLKKPGRGLTVISTVGSRVSCL